MDPAQHISLQRAVEVPAGEGPVRVTVWRDRAQDCDVWRVERGLAAVPDFNGAGMKGVKMEPAAVDAAFRSRLRAYHFLQTMSSLMLFNDLEMKTSRVVLDPGNHRVVVLIAMRRGQTITVPALPPFPDVKFSFTLNENRPALRRTRVAPMVSDTMTFLLYGKNMDPHAGAAFASAVGCVFHSTIFLVGESPCAIVQVPLDDLVQGVSRIMAHPEINVLDNIVINARELLAGSKFKRIVNVHPQRVRSAEFNENYRVANESPITVNWDCMLTKPQVQELVEGGNVHMKFASFVNNFEENVENVKRKIQFKNLPPGYDMPPLVIVHKISIADVFYCPEKRSDADATLAASFAFPLVDQIEHPLQELDNSGHFRKFIDRRPGAETFTVRGKDFAALATGREEAVVVHPEMVSIPEMAIPSHWNEREMSTGPTTMTKVGKELLHATNVTNESMYLSSRRATFRRNLKADPEDKNRINHGHVVTHAATSALHTWHNRGGTIHDSDIEIDIVQHASSVLEFMATQEKHRASDLNEAALVLSTQDTAKISTMRFRMKLEMSPIVPVTPYPTTVEFENFRAHLERIIPMKKGE
ncbi:Hypothetical Protein FCC1311_058112 [Hondaea fermentalgiana]|uniref:Uncharacterized protein n=1 Tax=Hondaea fermentalgiana TaxID=2315210 RepID=A0A2R5GF86_9STRA|nr:Hypothetical Protein FCC1311_058112 [Hondaea fermentalgiana]|eukprot:GBG29590.1 Hypothetical Protein FCC1311_058112 [Hondaea fermentalgiana]